MSMATNFGNMVTYNEELPPKKSHDYLITWSFEVPWQMTEIMSPLALNLVTCLEEVWPIKPHDPLVTRLWSRDKRDHVNLWRTQINTIKSPLS